jgi:hypothetical protein
MKEIQIRNVWESFERKHNASGTPKGRSVANREFAKTVIGLLESKKIGWSDISFTEMYRQLVHDTDLVESLDTSAFPTMTGQIILKKVIDSYQKFPMHGRNLVPTIPGELPNEDKIIGWTEVGLLSEVKEREHYKDISPPSEKFVRVRKVKRGGLLPITEEIIKYDRTGQYLTRASAIGEEAARTQEEVILKGVIDVDANVYDLGDLYASPSTSGGTNGNAFSGADTALGTAGWEKAHVKLMEQTDSQGRPIWAFGDRPSLMVPPRLEPTASKLKLGEYGDLGTANLDVNLAKNAFDVVVNPYYASLTTSKVWHYGAFPRQFVWVEDFPLQVFQLSGQQSEQGFRRDVIVEFKVRFQGGIGATGTEYVLRMSGE